MSLITNIEQIKAHVRVNSNMTRMPDVAAAEQEWLLPILGDDLYADLDAAGSKSAEQLALIEKCRAVIAPGAFVKDLALNQVQVTNNGLVSFENEQSRKAFKWEYNNVQEALLSAVYVAQEGLILFLKANADDYPLWESSPYNDAGGFHIIRDGRELSAVQSLQQPHRCYMALKPIFADIAETTLKEMMGEEQYLAINEAILTDDMGVDTEWLVKKLRAACAKLAMAKAVYTLNVKFGAGGFTVADKYGRDITDEARAAASGRQEAMLKEEMEKSAATLLSQARNYLNAKASLIVFPEYFESGLYSDPNAVSPGVDNSVLRGGFGV